MTLERIQKIKDHLIFIRFNWPKGLLDFKEKNLIYGWNGTGKSTLSNLFRLIEKNTPISEGEVEFIITRKSVNGMDLATTKELPQVRVFNEDFISENVFTSNGSTAPIFFLGEENIEKQKKIEDLQDDLSKARNDISEQETHKLRAEKDLDNFKKDSAKSIKEQLSSSGVNNTYTRYDKSSFQRKYDDLLRLSDSDKNAKILEASNLDAKKKIKESTQKEKLLTLNLSYPDIQKLTDQVVTLLKKTVVSAVIETLKNDQELSSWVKDGLTKHKKDSSSDCLFCMQSLPDDRIQELEAHFNDKYNSFIFQIKSQSDVVKTAIEALDCSSLPIAAQLNDHLKDDFNIKRQRLCNEIIKIKDYLEKLYKALEDKKKTPFQSSKLSFGLIVGNKNAIYELNQVIDRHNKETDNFQAEVKAARTAIEEHLVAKGFDDCQKKIVILLQQM
jgi:wobble nucleotide-excising tRNase